MTFVPWGIGSSLGEGAGGTRVLTMGVFHACTERTRRRGQNGLSRGGTVTPETLIKGDAPIEIEEIEELLVEEVSIDGLCGVY